MYTSSGLGLSILPGTAAPLLISPLAVHAAWEQCMQNSTNPARCGPEPYLRPLVQTLPTVTATARFPWGTVLALGVLAFLMLGRRR